MASVNKWDCFQFGCEGVATVFMYLAQPQWGIWGRRKLCESTAGNFYFALPSPRPPKSKKFSSGISALAAMSLDHAETTTASALIFFLSHCLLNSVVKHFSFYFLLVLCTDTFSSNAQHARENDNCLYGTINILVWMYLPRMSFIFVCFPRWCCRKVSSWMKSKVYIANAELCKRRMWICAAFAMHCWATVN